jgi:hypothetical protein
LSSDELVIRCLISFFLNTNKPTKPKKEKKTSPAYSLNAKHRSCPLTPEMQLLGPSISYCRLTIVFNRAYKKKGMAIREAINRV